MTPVDQDADHRADYQAKRLMDDTRRAIKALLDDEQATIRLSLADRLALRDLSKRLQAHSAHIVAVWD